MDKKKLSIKFESTVLKKEASFPYSEYTEYDLKVSNQDVSWSIRRRYNDFLKIHNKNKKNFKTLPQFPSKKFFPLRDTVVNERILLLENYVNFLYSEIKNLVLNKKYEYLYNFIGLDELKNVLVFPLKCESVKYLSQKINRNSSFLSSDSDDEDLKFNQLDREYSPYECIRFMTTQVEECIIDRNIVTRRCPIIKTSKLKLNDFLVRINSDPINLSNYCAEFMKMISKGWRELDDEQIYHLYFGKIKQDRKIKGIIYFAGRFEEFQIGSYMCLDLISNSLLIERNSESERFTQVFKKATISQMKELNIVGYYYLRNMEKLHKCFYAINKWNSKFDSNQNLLEEIFDDDLNLMDVYERYISCY